MLPTRSVPEEIVVVAGAASGARQKRAAAIAAKKVRTKCVASELMVDVGGHSRVPSSCSWEMARVVLAGCAPRGPAVFGRSLRAFQRREPVESEDV
jgi:hypothetical protein